MFPIHILVGAQAIWLKFLSVFSVLPGKCRNSASIRPRLLPTSSFLICPTIILAHKLYSLRDEKRREVKHSHLLVSIFLCSHQIHCSKHYHERVVMKKVYFFSPLTFLIPDYTSVYLTKNSYISEPAVYNLNGRIDTILSVQQPKYFVLVLSGI
jgi:hypothetical protein